MASDFLGTYDPTEVSLIVGGLNISGFMDGTFITCKMIDPELYKTHVGAWGEVSRTKNPNNAGQYVFTLKKTSPSNLVLDLLKRNPAAFPVLCKNNSDANHLAVGTECWISIDPDITYGDEESGVEWTITSSSLIMSHF